MAGRKDGAGLRFSGEETLWLQEKNRDFCRGPLF